MDTITSISWDWLENAFVCDQGYCYKTLEDVPQEFRHLVKVSSELYIQLQYNKNKQTKIVNDR